MAQGGKWPKGASGQGDMWPRGQVARGASGQGDKWPRGADGCEPNFNYIKIKFYIIFLFNFCGPNSTK